MFFRIGALLVLFCQFKVSDSINPNHFHFSEYITSFNTEFHSENQDIAITTANILQPLDQLSQDSSNSSKRFEQRFLYTEQFSLNRNTVFLYVSGAETLKESVMRDKKSFMMKAAKELGATVFALEHRYYGESMPEMGNNNFTNLQHLSSSHAIRDVISFIAYANSHFHFDPDARWILWGAGYGGMIAAEARKMDPVLVSGVVTVSAPMKREFDFWKYNNKVELEILRVGGEECHGKIKEGFEELQSMMHSENGRKELSKLFGLEPSLNEDLTESNIQMFYLSLMAPFQQIVQYNGQFSLSILSMCDDVVLKTERAVERIHQVYAYLSKTLTGEYTPMQSNYQRYVEKLGYRKKTDGEEGTIDSQSRRFWQYQTCTEFGWFYTTNDNENGLFGSIVPTSLFLNQCFDIFPSLYRNSSVLKIRDDVESARKSFGAYNSTNAVFINGARDPWAMLGNTVSDKYSVVVWNVSKASHFFDFSKLPKDVEESVMENVKGWVQGPKEALTVEDVNEPWKIPNEKVTVRRKFSKLENDARFSKFEEHHRVSKKVLDQKTTLKKRFQMMRPIINPDTRIPAKKYFSSEHFETSRFRQRVDHFDNKNPRFFQQKFYKNSKFAKPDGPNFLYIGGEGPENGYAAIGEKTESMRRAKKFGGTMYVLEHRYYGDSLVDNNTDLTHLHSLQALYDIAKFIRAIDYRTGTSNPWITTGGSYPGMLSAWMRQLFPELVVGAYASSAPVQSKTDFYEFMMVVENAYLRYDPSCYNQINETFTKLNELIYTESGRDYLTQKFNITPPLNQNFTSQHIGVFFSILTGKFTAPVQYAGFGEGAFTNQSWIALQCRQMMNRTGTGVDNLAAIVGSIDLEVGDEEELWDADSMKLWTWQTCTEFGFYQTTDLGKSIFGAVSSVSLAIQDCMDMFGQQYSRFKVDEAVEKSNLRYGGADGFRGTNVIFTNGDVDPWHPLGVLHNSTDPTVISILIRNTSHCADLASVQKIDLPQIRETRDTVDRHMEQWLKEAGEKKKKKKNGKKDTNSAGSKLGNMVLVFYMISSLLI